MKWLDLYSIGKFSSDKKMEMQALICQQNYPHLILSTLNRACDDIKNISKQIVNF